MRNAYFRSLIGRRKSEWTMIAQRPENLETDNDRSVVLAERSAEPRYCVWVFDHATKNTEQRFDDGRHTNDPSEALKLFVDCRSSHERRTR